MKSVIYVRTNRRGTEAVKDIEDQRERCLHHAVGFGGTVTDIFVDQAPGLAVAPPSLARLIEEASLGHVEHVVVSEVNRFGRDVLRVGLLLARLAELGVDVRVAPPRRGDVS